MQEEDRMTPPLAACRAPCAKPQAAYFSLTSSTSRHAACRWGASRPCGRVPGLLLPRQIELLEEDVGQRVFATPPGVHQPHGPGRLARAQLAERDLRGADCRADHDIGAVEHFEGVG